jgi:tRNA(adenine34) deaminase
LHKPSTADAIDPAAADDLRWMQRALALARDAEAEGEVPVGALLVRDDIVIGEGWNRSIILSDASAHAEIQALRAAGQTQQNYRFPDATLYVTLEPCAMCAMALVHARVARVVYAAADPKTGAAGSVFDILTSEKHNHRIRLQSGVCAEESSELLRQFFRKRR